MLSSLLPVQAATITGPSRLEANLSYMPFDVYDDDVIHVASSYGFPNSCPAGSTVRSCFQTVLANLRAEGVSGVRIFFGLCGGGRSTPLVNCGQDWTNVSGPVQAWRDRVGYFFDDVLAAGIQNITITVAHQAGEELYDKPKGQTTTPAPFHCAYTPDTVYFYAAVPYGLKEVVLPNNEVVYYPIGQGQNGAWNCAPKNPYFVGWQNQYNVIDYMLGAASSRGLTVNELEFEQETNLTEFTVQARYIVDNAHADSGQTNVRDALRYYMNAHGFDPWRVAWSATANGSSVAGKNCTNVYTGYARLMNAQQIASAIGGGVIGRPYLPSPVGGLVCGGTTSGMINMSSYGALPNIVDIHLRPCVVGTCAYVQSEAVIDFSDIVHHLALLNLQSATVAFGETHSNTNDPLNPGFTCEGTPSTAPVDTVAGYIQSTLAGHSVIFRPWMQLQSPSGDCFTYPSNQHMNYGWNGPYTPTQW